MVSVVYVVGTPGCEAGGMGSTPFGHPSEQEEIDHGSQDAGAGVSGTVGEMKLVAIQSGSF